MTDLWKAVTGPSAGTVQQHFVKARLDDLKRRNPELEKKVEKVLVEHPLLSSLKLAKSGKWLDVYRTINRNLQAAELTINIEPTNWFSKENPYDTYAQTYERGATSEGRNIIRDDSFGTGEDRARVDDAVTIPASWTAPAAAGQPAQRGLRPGVRAGQDIAKRMMFGGRTVVAKDDATQKKAGVESMNPYFNPKTKQVFAALNYARRPRGSLTYYGKSYIVLSERLKANALYFPSDTFTIEAQGAHSQVSFGMLAAVLGMASPKMVDDLIQSCYFGIAQQDSGFANMLLEAHLFEELRFRGGISAICIGASHRTTDIGVNARKFAVKQGAKLHWIAEN